MKNTILNLGKALSRAEQKEVHGGMRLGPVEPSICQGGGRCETDDDCCQSGAECTATNVMIWNDVINSFSWHYTSLCSI